jgi:transcriptional regulator with XRE-family HTH domain
MPLDATRVSRYNPTVLGQRLREEREARDWTQEALSAATGDRVSRATIAHIETGRVKNGVPAVIYLLAQVLDVDEDWLSGK